MAAAISMTLPGISAKTNPVFETPVEQAVRGIPKVAAAALEAARDHIALERHLGRVKKAPDAKAEAAETEALVAWLHKNKVAEVFVVSLGHRCPKLTDEELLALSSWPTCRLQLAGGVRAPIIVHEEIDFKDPKNVLRLVSLAVPTEGWNPK